MQTSLKSSCNSEQLTDSVHVVFYLSEMNYSLFHVRLGGVWGRGVYICLIEESNCQFELVKRHVNNKPSLRCTLILMLYVHRQVCVCSKAEDKLKLHD